MIGAWFDEFAEYLATAGRQSGKLAVQRGLYERLANEGHHVHEVSTSTAVCANGDNTCSVWRSQQPAATGSTFDSPPMHGSAL